MLKSIFVFVGVSFCGMWGTAAWTSSLGFQDNPNDLSIPETYSQPISLNQAQQSALNSEQQDQDTRIQSIRKALDSASVPHGETCLDEYLARRDSLIWRLGLWPVSAPATTVAVTYGGLAAGAGAAYAVGQAQSWAALGYMILGGMAGAAVSSVTVVAKGISSGVRVHQLQRMMKAIFEARMLTVKPEIAPIQDSALGELFAGLRPESGINSIQALGARLVQLDTRGALCDGSIRPRSTFWWTQSKLNRLLARPGHVIDYLNADGSAN